MHHAFGWAIDVADGHSFHGILEDKIHRCEYGIIRQDEREIRGGVTIDIRLNGRLPARLIPGDGVCDDAGCLRRVEVEPLIASKAGIGVKGRKVELIGQMCEVGDSVIAV